MIANGYVVTPSNDRGLIIANGAPQTRHNGLVIVNGLSDRIDSYIGSPTARLSTVDGNAFAWISEKNLIPYLGHKIVVTDSAGKEATGYIKEADANEAVTNYTTSDFSVNADGWARNTADPAFEITGNNDGISGENNCLKTYANGGNKPYQIKCSKGFLVEEALYKISFRYYADAGCGIAHFGVGVASNRWSGYNTTIVEGSWQTVSAFYITEVFAGTQVFLFTGYTTETGQSLDALINGKAIYFKDWIIDKVDHIGADGVHIVSASGSVTRNWTSIDSGFNPNDIDFVNIYDK